MITRIRKAMDERDQGFTLIELLVVIIIIGILAAIAIPIFLNQRQKAVDVAAEADVSSIAKHVATHFVDNDTVPTLAVSGDTYTMTVGSDPAVNLGPVSGDLDGVAVALTPADADASTFVVTLTFSGGTQGAGATVAYSATTGLGEIQKAGGGDD